MVEDFLLANKGSTRAANAKDANGTSLLMWAASADKKKIVKLLLLHGAEKNYQRSDKMAAIHYAAMGGNNKALLALLKIGAKPDLADLHGHTPLMHAAKAGKDGMGNLETVKMLLEYGAKPTLFTADHYYFCVPNGIIDEYITNFAKK